MKHIRDLNKGLELESGDRRKDELAKLRLLGLVQMERIAAIPSQIVGNFEHGGAPPYNRYTTTELGNRLARFLERQGR